MVAGFAWLLLFQLAGEVLVRSLQLPVPGPVVGMVLLFGWLQWRRPAADAGTMRAADGLLRHLQLLFVPAGVGVVLYGAVLRQDGPAIVVALVVSWLLGLAAVGWTAQLLTRERAR